MSSKSSSPQTLRHLEEARFGHQSEAELTRCLMSRHWTAPLMFHIQPAPPLKSSDKIQVDMISGNLEYWTRCLCIFPLISQLHQLLQVEDAKVEVLVATDYRSWWNFEHAFPWLVY